MTAYVEAWAKLKRPCHVLSTACCSWIHGSGRCVVKKEGEKRNSHYAKNAIRDFEVFITEEGV